jgi:hypothetical protein
MESMVSLGAVRSQSFFAFTSASFPVSYATLYLILLPPSKFQINVSECGDRADQLFRADATSMPEYP